MSISRLILKYMPGILIIILLCCVLLVFRSYQNILVAEGITKIPAWAIFFLIIISAIGVLYYFLLMNAFGKFKNIETDLFTLKRQIEQAKQKDDEVVEKISETRIDIERESSQLIPEYNDPVTKFGELLLSRIASKYEIVQGIIYLKNPETGIFSFSSGYAFYSDKEPVSYKEGENLSGQVAKNKEVLNLYPVPEGYITVFSGLGKGTPKHLLIVPAINPDNETIGIIELASYKAFDDLSEQLFELVGRKLGTILSKPIKP